jgi:predicted MPP superfamily phosphohydrolase
MARLRTGWGSWRAVGLAVAALGAFAAAGVDARVPDVRRTGIGSATAPLHITQLSDLHLRDNTALNMAIAAVARGAAGDVIVLTGDVLDRGDRLPALDGFLGALGQAVPVLATTGNWEHWASVDRTALADVYARHGVRFLRDTRVRLELGAPSRPVDVVGIDDGPSPRSELPFGLLPSAAASAGVPLLVLTHHPATAYAVAHALGGRADRPLILAGHTHGGQIALFGWAPVLPPGSAMGSVRAVDGAYPQPAADVWVSRGVGASLVDLRWGVPSTVDALVWGP